MKASIRSLPMFCILLSVLLGINTAQAVTGVGSHGGDAVICFKTQSIRDEIRDILIANRNKNYPDDPFTLVPSGLKDIESLEVYDLFLARQGGMNQPLKLISGEGKSYEKILAERMELIRTKSRYFSVLEESQKVLSPSHWIGVENGVIEIDDSQEQMIFGPSCLLIQVASQVGARVHYDKRLWNGFPLWKGGLSVHLDPLNQSALKLHEFAIRKAPDSPAAQKLVGIAYSEEFESMSGKDFNDQLKSVELTAGNYSESILIRGKPVLVWNQELDARDYQFVTVHPYRYRFQDGFEILFSSFQLKDPTVSGRILWGVLSEDQTLRNGVRLPKNTKLLFSEKGFYEEGFFDGVHEISGIPCEGKNGVWTYEWKSVALAEPELLGDKIMYRLPIKKDLQFYPSGRLKTCVLAYDTQLDGKTYPQRSWIRLKDEDGNRVAIGVQKAMLDGVEKDVAEVDGKLFTLVAFYPSNNLKFAKPLNPYIWKGIRFFDPDYVKTVDFYDSENPEISTGPLEGVQYIPWSLAQGTAVERKTISCKNTADFYFGGAIYSCYLAEAVTLNGITFENPTSYNRLSFYETPEGSPVKSGVLKDEQKIQGFLLSGAIELYPNGKLKHCICSKTQTVRGIKYQSGDRLSFDENGNITRSH